MLNLVLLDKPDHEYRQVFKTLKSKISFVGQQEELGVEYNENLARELRRSAFNRVRQRYHKETVELGSALSAIIQRVSSERYGDAFTVSLQQDEARVLSRIEHLYGVSLLPPRDELASGDCRPGLMLTHLRSLFDHVSRHNFELPYPPELCDDASDEDEPDIPKIPAPRKPKEIASLLSTLRSEVSMLEELKTELNDRMARLRRNKPWVKSRLLRVAALSAFVDDPESAFRSDIIYHAIGFCTKVLHEILTLVVNREAYHYDRFAFEDVRMCYHMCLLAKMKLNEMEHEMGKNPLPSSAYCNTLQVKIQSSKPSFQAIAKMLNEIWNASAVWMYPDVRYDDLFTISRYYRLSFHCDHSSPESRKVPSADTVLWFLRFSEPQKHQPTKGTPVLRRKIQADMEDRVLIPLLSTIQAFFKLGVYSFSLPRIVEPGSKELWNYAHRYQRNGPVDSDFFCDRLSYSLGMIAAKEYRLELIRHAWKELDRVFDWFNMYRLLISSLADTIRRFQHPRVDHSAVSIQKEYRSVMEYVGFVLSKMAVIRSRIQPGIMPLHMIYNRHNYDITTKRFGSGANESDDEPLGDSDDSDSDIQLEDESADRTTMRLIHQLESNTRAFVHYDATKSVRAKIVADSKQQMAVKSLRKQARKSAITSLRLKDIHQGNHPLRFLLEPFTVGSCDSTITATLQADLDHEADPVLHSIFDPHSKTATPLQYLLKSQAIFQAAPHLGAIVTSDQLLPHERAMLDVLAIRPIHIRNFLAVWRFSCIVGYWIGMTPFDEYVLLVLLSDFYRDRTGPSTISNAAKIACEASPIIHGIACVWTKLTSFLWSPLTASCCNAQAEAVAERLRLLSHDGTRSIFETLAICGVCGTVKTIHNAGMSIGRADTLQLVSASKMIGFSNTSISLIGPIQVYCSRVGLNVSSKCTRSPVVRLDLFNRRVFRLETDEVWQLCGSCGIPMKITSDEFYTVNHPTKGAMCVDCSTSKYSHLTSAITDDQVL